MPFIRDDGDAAGEPMLIAGDGEEAGMGIPLMLPIGEGDGDAAAMPMPPMPWRSTDRT